VLVDVHEVDGAGTNRDALQLAETGVAHVDRPGLGVGIDTVAVLVGTGEGIDDAEARRRLTSERE